MADLWCSSKCRTYCSLFEAVAWSPSRTFGSTIWGGCLITIQDIRFDNLRRLPDHHPGHSVRQFEAVVWSPSRTFGWTIWGGCLITIQDIRFDNLRRLSDHHPGHSVRQFEAVAWSPSRTFGSTILLSKLVIIIIAKEKTRFVERVCLL